MAKHQLESNYTARNGKVYASRCKICLQKNVKKPLTGDCRGRPNFSSFGKAKTGSTKKITDKGKITSKRTVGSKSTTSSSKSSKSDSGGRTIRITEFISQGGYPIDEPIKKDESITAKSVAEIPSHVQRQFGKRNPRIGATLLEATQWRAVTQANIKQLGHVSTDMQNKFRHRVGNYPPRPRKGKKLQRVLEKYGAKLPQRIADKYGVNI